MGLLKKTPLSFRQKLASGFRKKSREANQVKSYEVMDVNQDAVQAALSNADLLIHGHTHRPKVHDVNGKPRIVLGDWREHEAQILEISENATVSRCALKTWRY